MSPLSAADVSNHPLNNELREVENEMSKIGHSKAIRREQQPRVPIPLQRSLRSSYLFCPSLNRSSTIGVSAGRGMRFKSTMSQSTTSSR